jgi:biopolymer transport protein ExbD
MGGLDMGAAPAAGPKTGVLYHLKKRVGVAIDMTPMVDIAFLLLIFFMLTTVFRLPQAMELNQPNSKVPVPESSVLMLYVYGDGQIVYRMGTDGPVEPVEFSGLRSTVSNLVQANDKLITLVKFERSTPYHWMVDVLDEFILGKVSRYSFDAMTPEEVAEIKAKAGA